MSRYLTLYSSTGTSVFQTLATGAASVRSGQLSSRRITLLNGSTSHFVAFGTSTVVATTSSAVLPPNAVLDFNFTSGQYVAALAASGSSYITIIDAD